MASKDPLLCLGDRNSGTVPDVHCQPEHDGVVGGAIYWVPERCGADYDGLS